MGGISPVSHAQALERMRQAGATPVTAIQFGSELMRNWARSISNSFRKALRWYFPRRFGLMKEGKIGQSGIRCANDRGETWLARDHSTAFACSGRA